MNQLTSGTISPDDEPQGEARIEGQAQPSPLPPWEEVFTANSYAFPWFMKHYRDIAELLNRWIDQDMTFRNLDDYPFVMDSLYNGVAQYRDAVLSCYNELKGE